MAAQRPIRIRYPCRADGCPALIEFAPDALEEPVVECPRCRDRRAVEMADRLDVDRRLTRCPICDCSEFFLRKDFPQIIGLSIVVIAAALSIWTLRSNALLAYGILAAAAIIDALLYFLFPKITVCYRCRAEFRGIVLHPEHTAFDLATHEKYR